MRLTYLEKGHISHLGDRLRLLDGSIWIEDIWTPALQREGDQSIMEAFLHVTAKGATPRKLEMANLCQMWMKVITVSELATVEGRQIPAERLNGK